MREKRYSKDMKGTQGKEEERYPFLEVFPLKRKAIREIKKYALEFVEDLNDGEYFKNPTLKNVRKRMLGGLSDYAQTGCGEEMAKIYERATCYFYCFAVFDK